MKRLYIPICINILNYYLLRGYCTLLLLLTGRYNLSVDHLELIHRLIRDKVFWQHFEIQFNLQLRSPSGNLYQTMGVRIR